MSRSLSQTLFPEILFPLSKNGATGTLNIVRQSDARRVLVEGGVVVYAESLQAEENLGAFLARIGKLSPSQLGEVTSLVTPAKPMPLIIMEKGLIESGELKGYLETYVQELIFPVFEWEDGQCEFTAEDLSIDPTLKLTLSVPNLILEGVRRISNGQIIHRALGGDDRVLGLSPQFESQAAELLLKPDEAFVLTRIESNMKVGEVLQVSPLGLEMTQKTLYAFLSTGILRFASTSWSRPESSRRRDPGRTPAPQAQPPPGDARPKGSGPSRPTPDFELETFERVATKQTPARAEPIERNQTPAANPRPVEAPLPEEEQEQKEDLEPLRSEILQMLENAKSSNHYDLLKVLPQASAEEIKRSYYSLAKKYHPDRYHQASASDLKDALDTIFSSLSQAYDVLKVPATRVAYDARLFPSSTPSSTESAAIQEAPPINNYSKVGAAQQKLAELNYRQGRGHYEHQDFWSAIQALRQAVRFDPENGRYRYWLAMSLTKNPKWLKEAEEHFLKAIELDQFNANYHVGLGLMYRDLGMRIKAEKQLKKAVELSPDDSPAQEAYRSLSGKKPGSFAALKKLFGRK